MSDIHLKVRVHLNKDWHTDPVVEADVGGATLDDIVATSKQLGADLAKLAGATGIKKIDILNGHEVLGFLNIPV